MERGIERLFGHAELGEANRHKALRPEHEQRQRRLDGQNLQAARAGRSVAQLRRRAVRINQHLKRRQEWVKTHGSGHRVGVGQLIVGVYVRFQLEAFHRGAFSLNASLRSPAWPPTPLTGKGITCCKPPLSESTRTSTTPLKSLG